MKKFAILIVLLFGLFILNISTAFAECTDTSTRVRGHCNDGRYDKDDNGYTDAGVYVNGHYYSVYAYDTTGDYYWDLGDGRVYGVGSIDELNSDTLTVCDYVINYRADFGNDPFMDAGWIQNHINCYGYDDNGQYNYLIVHRSDPRFREENLDPGWGPNWRYSVLTISGQGNIAQPENHAGN